MTSTFNTTALVDGNVLVKGTDVFGETGTTMVDGSQWEAIKADAAFNQATDAFDEAVAEFFKPLTEAAEKLHRPTVEPDPASYVVLQEAVEPTAGQPEQLIKLTRDSVILRLIESGDTNRLVWVTVDGVQRLEVLAHTSAPAAGDTAIPTDAGMAG